MRSKLALVFSLLVVVSMLLAACGQATTAAPATEGPATEVATTDVATEAPTEPAELPTLRVQVASFPDMLDPQKASFLNEIGHVNKTWEGLTLLNGDLETVPGSAEKWEFSADGLTLTFTLRPNLKYSDGSILNAKRFEYSLKRLVDPTVAGEYAGSTDEIVGAVEYRTADLAKATPEDLAKLRDAVGITALDSKGAACTGYEQEDCNTLQIKLKKLAPYFPTIMSMWVSFPAKEELITAGGDTWWLDAANYLGNGPFIMTSLEANVMTTFVPNPNYWQGQPKYKLEYRYITDSAVSFEAYKNDEFDIINLAAEDLATVESDPTLNAQKMIYPGNCTFSVYFTSFKEPFTDPKVREAFIYATDRDGWVNTVLKGLGSVTLTWIPKGFPGYDPDETRFAFDPEKAKAVLAESDWVKAGKPLDITFTFSDSPRNRTRFEFLANRYQEVLGIQVKLNPVEPTTYSALTKDKATIPQVFYLGWCSDYPDPQNWLSIYWMSTSEYAKRYGYANPELDVIMQNADSELDPAKRAQYYMDAQRLLIADRQLAFLFNSVSSYLVKPWVKGIQTTPQDGVFAGDVNPLTITIEK